MNELKKLETRIELIEKRNSRVEMDKAWETSLARKFFIALLTYLVISTFFLFIEVKDPFVNAIVPTLGFLLSTLTLNILKEIWMKNMLKLKDIRKISNER